MAKSNPKSKMATPSLLRSPAALSRFLATAAIGLALDLWTKWIAQQKLSGGGTYSLISGWLEFDWTQNRGAVFGWGQGRQVLFVVASIGAIVFLAYLFLSSGDKRLHQLLLGVLLAGVLGNLYDRLMFGWVRDMIHALPGRQWPDWAHHALPFLPREIFPWVFNVADSLLCVGVTLMIVCNLWPARGAEQAGQSQSANA